MDLDQFDFSPIDPSRDPERWERLIAQVSAHAMANPVSINLVRWSRALIATAMLAVAAAWLPALLGEERAAEPATMSAATLAEWANHGEVPEGVDVLEVVSDGE